MTVADEIFEDRMTQAGVALRNADFVGLLEQRQAALERLLEARRQLTEAKRLHTDAKERQDAVALDAIYALDWDPAFKWGSNKEIRDRQAEKYLRAHGPWRVAETERKAALRGVERAADEERRAEAAVEHLGLMIGARRSELDLLASFARGAS